MAHSMGIHKITLSPKSNVYNQITYNGNTYSDNTWTPISRTGSAYTCSASTQISSTIKPYVQSNVCYLIAKPSTTPTVTASLYKASSSTYNYPWKNVCETSTRGAIKTYTVTYPVEYIAATWNFEYSGNVKTFPIQMLLGKYSFACWGGGYNSASTFSLVASYGGYVYGEKRFDDNDILYVSVGTRIVDASSSVVFGGGGISINGPTGAGATDVRVGSNDLKSRFIVAGGAGVSSSGSTESSHAGGLVGYDGDHRSNSEHAGNGGGQNYGGAAPTFYSQASSNGTAGTFGVGGSGGLNSGDGRYGGGGGGGWYGGSGGSGANTGHFNGGGGSSFVSGHPGCNGVNSSGTHRGASQPSTIKINGVETAFSLSATKVIDGKGRTWTSATPPASVTEQMPNPSGGFYGSGIGHAGYGYCRITYIP